MQMWREFLDEVGQTGLSIDEFLALYKQYSYEEGSDTIDYKSDMFSTYIDLEAKGYIKIYTGDNEAMSYHLREKGKMLIEQLSKTKNIPVKSKETVIPEDKKILNNNHKFEEFWLMFPNSDEHGVFRKTRILKAGKELCKKKYISLLEDNVDHDDVLKALKYEIKLRKDSNNKNNNMTYMKNSLTWLNQREFDIILETMVEDNQSNSENDWTSNAI